jgi:hypothetical protein
MTGAAASDGQCDQASERSTDRTDNTAAFLSDDCPRRTRYAVARLAPCSCRGLNGLVKQATSHAPAKPLPSRRSKKGSSSSLRHFARRIDTQRFVQRHTLKPSHPTWTTLKTTGEKLPLLQTSPN